MKKLSLLIFYQDYQQFLGELRERGVVHIHENKKRSAEDEELKQKMALVKRVGEMIKLLEKRLSLGREENAEVTVELKRAENPVAKLVVYHKIFGLSAPDTSGNPLTDLDLLVFLENRYRRQEQIDLQIQGLLKDKSLYGPWGDFSRKPINGLREAGWDLRFFTVPDKKYLPEWEDKYNAFPVSMEKGQTYFVTLSPVGVAENPEADPVVFPEAEPDELQRQMNQLQAEKKDINCHLDDVAKVSVEFFKNHRTRIYEDTDVLKVTGASDSLLEDKVVVLEGWVPEAIAEETDRWLADKGVYYELDKPEMEDNPPVLLKNNKFARLFEFIGELYSLPNYREIDLTPFFAPFFLLFFGLCLGDSGYGLFILVAVSIYKLKAKPSLKPVLSLAQWLGFGTMILGFISGTFFGIPLAEVSWMEKFKVVMLDSKQLFNLALIIGVVQIIFGMFIKVANLWKQYGFGAALSTIGWLIMILGGGACYLLSAKGYDVRMPMYAVGGVAGLLIFLFNNLKRNVFINVGAGAWDTYNMVTGLMGDTLSYIRLFALGISGSVLGLVFNNLAMNMSGDIPVLSQLIMLVILLFGHGVNIFIASLGAFVHPMRLTFVEFYKNSGFEGGGKKYQPFKKRI